jgi:pimeloyl-ACP methyl ester carboxylesterase
LIEGYAQTVAELLRLLAPGTAVTLIGNSLGGAVALQLALDRPELVQRLVLVDCAGLGRGVPLWWRLITLNVQPARVALTNLRVVPPRLVEGVAGIIYERLAFRHPGRVDQQIIRGFARHYQSLRDVDDMLDIGHDMVRELMSAGLLQRAAGLDVPTLVLWGRNDRLVPVSHGEALARVLLRGTLSVIEDCGHCPQVERPEMFLQAVAPFLAQEASGDLRLAATDAASAT